MTKRLDEWLVQKAHFESLLEAQRAIRAGRVLDRKSGLALDKVGQRVSKTLEVDVIEPPKFVSRGGDKLDHFLSAQKISLKGRTVLDVGASTGGFTDCALSRGAQMVFAVDVGTNQLHERLKADSRVHSFENTDIRQFDLKGLKPAPDLVLVDVAFISLRRIVPSLTKALPEAEFIFLFKPQFEVSRYSPKRRGVADPDEAARSLQEMLQFLGSLGLNVRMVAPSAIKGAKGNQEVFIMAEVAKRSHIFRTYDIRGHAERDLPSDLVFRIGVVLGRRLVKKAGLKASIGVGRDARISSERIFKALTWGLHRGGASVVSLGEVTTPMTYFAHYHLPLKAVVQVTASHNPKDDNGMKMMMLKDTLFGEEIRSLGDEVPSVDLPFDAENMGSLKIEDQAAPLRKAYLNFLSENLKFSRAFKMALDCGNGMVGAVAREAFSRVATDLKILHETVDCRFPNHEADPTVPANLEDLQREMAAQSYDIGFAFDGDGDRLGILTSKGRILWGDEILMLLSELVLKEKPGSTIIGEVKCSEKLFRRIEANGGKSLMYMTGHSLIKKKMKEMAAPLAGEMSGHLFFADRFFGFDDAVYAALRVLEVIDKLKINLDDWIEKFPASFVTPEIRVECEEEQKAEMVEKARQYFAQLPDTRVHLIDGVRVSFSDGSWALVRASNTQAVLVVRVEGTSDARLAEVVSLVERALDRKISTTKAGHV